MDKEVLVHIHNGISVYIIQSEISQKEKYQYSILTHIYGIYKDGTDESVCRAALETQI